MATLEEEREKNRRLKAEREVRMDFIRRNEERERLRKENKQLSRGGKESASVRLKKAFTQTGQTVYPGIKTFGRGVKSYGEYLAGPEPSSEKKEHYREHKGEMYYFKRIGKNRYKKIVVRKKQHGKPHKKVRHSTFGKSYFGGGSNIFGSSNIHRQSEDLFRRTI